MKDINTYLNEATTEKWVAIEDTTEANEFYKEKTTYRVVTYSTYLDLKNGKSRGGWMRHHIEKLGVANTRDGALEYLPSSNKTARKSDINKGSAQFIVYAIGMGTMNPQGKTSFGWSVWDEWKNEDMEIYFSARSFLFGTAGSLKVGDTLCVVDNDSRKKLPGATSRVEAVCKCTKEDFVDAYRSAFPSSCKRPSYSFGRHLDGLPWTRMGQMSSIKGIE